MFEKLKRSTTEFVRQYGRLGLAVYLSISTISIACCYTAVRAGVDPKRVMNRVGYELDARQERWGSVVAAYAIHKILLPVRISATVFLTGFLSKWRGKPKL